MRKFKVKTKDKPGGKLIRGIARKVKQKPIFINLNDGEMDKRSIIIGNHSGAKGAFTYRTFLATTAGQRVRLLTGRLWITAL